jgi:adenine-specific DNA methylase
MLKRLIEVALPLKEVSEQSAREKSIRHGHISTLHIWWARRPLAACRAAVFASLIPDPDDPECPEAFRKLVNEVLSRGEFKPKNGDGTTVEDTPRNRCLEFIKHLVKWENSNNLQYIEPARRLIAAAHRIPHPDAEGNAPKVLDSFAGGGAIPLEALRLGCEAHAIDLNPVAHLIELCTLVYPQKYGQPDSRPVPDYIKRLITHNRAKHKAKAEADLFNNDETFAANEDGVIPDIEITEAEYRKNPLAADVKYFGHWVLEKAQKRIGNLYSNGDAGETPVAYLWARSVQCPNPICQRTIPLYRRSLLSTSRNSRTALRFNFNSEELQIAVVSESHIDFDPEIGTIRAGSITCPYCNHSEKDRWLQAEGKKGRINNLPLAIVTVGKHGKHYRAFTPVDQECLVKATAELERFSFDVSLQPLTEQISDKRPSPNSRGLSAVTRYGFNQFRDLFNHRQLLSLLEFCRSTRSLSDHLTMVCPDEKYQQAIMTYIGLSIGRLADFNSTFCTWLPSGEFLGHTFTRHALGMVWDYAEVNPFSGSTGDWRGGLDWICRVIEHCSSIMDVSGHVHIGNALRLPFDDGVLDAVLTDPPYYDSVPYADISDYFYVWLKRAVGGRHDNVGRTPLTPKSSEIVMHAGREGSVEKAIRKYEELMTEAFREQSRVLSPDGIEFVVFAHRTTAAWEALIAALLSGGLSVVASWPLRTERSSRLVAQQTASLASSIIIICRKRSEDAGDGLWDDIRQELKQVAQERLNFFWNQGIRGADFFISAIGPALSVFGRYARVIRLSGEEVTVGEFLDEVRSLVTIYALTKILHTTHTANIDSENRFYVVWKWSYGDAKVPADESFKLSHTRSG